MNKILTTDVMTDVNRWLRNKFMMADCVQWAPDISKTYEKFRERVLKGLENGGYAWDSYLEIMVDRYLEEYGEDKISNFSIFPEFYKDSAAKKQSYMNVFLFDTRLLEDGTMELFSWLDSENSLLSVKPEFCDLGDPSDPDGDYKKNAVKKLMVIKGTMPNSEVLDDLIMKALDIPFTKRWMLAPVSFRREYPICPVCGGPIHVKTKSRGDYFFETNNVYSYECYSCSWEMDRERETNWDLKHDYVEKLFTLEQRDMKKHFKIAKTTTDCITSIRTSLDRLAKVYAKDKAGRANVRKRIEEYVRNYLPEDDNKKG